MFFEAVIKESAALTDQDRKRLTVSMRATLAGAPRPTPPPPKTSYEGFFSEFFRAWSELFQAYENVIFMTKLPRLKFKRTETISRLQFLTFVLESSFNEFYMFSERLEKFLSVTKRKYRADREIQIFIPKALAVVQKTLQPIINIRGSHVHNRRFSSDDEIIGRASVLELLVAAGKMKKLRPIYKSAFAHACSHILNIIKNHARYAKIVLASVFKHLCVILVDRAGRLRYPTGISGPKILE